MKQYSPAFQPQPLSSRQGKKEIFFEPASFFKSKQNPSLQNVQLKWFPHPSSGLFLLAVKGIDAQTFKELLLLLKSKSKSHETCEVSSLSELMACFVELTGNEPISNPTEDFHPESEASAAPDFLTTVDKKIEENLGDEHFRGSDLARLLCCCEMQLYRKIKQFSKISPSNYIRRYRLRRSLQSLSETELSISQICLNVGFKSLEYFSRSFKKEFGMCPSEFRTGRMLY